MYWRFLKKMDLGKGGHWKKTDISVIYDYKTHWWYGNPVKRTLQLDPGCKRR